MNMLCRFLLGLPLFAAYALFADEDPLVFVSQKSSIGAANSLSEFQASCGGVQWVFSACEPGASNCKNSIQFERNPISVFKDINAQRMPGKGVKPCHFNKASGQILERSELENLSRSEAADVCYFYDDKDRRALGKWVKDGLSGLASSVSKSAQENPGTFSLTALLGGVSLYFAKNGVKPFMDFVHGQHTRVTHKRSARRPGPMLKRRVAGGADSGSGSGGAGFAGAAVASSAKEATRGAATGVAMRRSNSADDFLRLKAQEAGASLRGEDARTLSLSAVSLADAATSPRPPSLTPRAARSRSADSRPRGSTDGSDVTGSDGAREGADQ